MFSSRAIAALLVTGVTITMETLDLAEAVENKANRKLAEIPGFNEAMFWDTYLGSKENSMPSSTKPISTTEPTYKPTYKPTATPSKNTIAPTRKPTDKPTIKPTDKLTDKPTIKPTDKPTDKTTDQPTDKPTTKQTGEPTANPTEKPTEKNTAKPTTQKPTKAPVIPPPTVAPSAQSVIVPTEPPTCKPISEIACTTPGFETLCSLITLAELIEPLTSDLATVFAPTDEAFEKLPPELVTTVTSDPELLRNVLWYHVVPNKEIFAKDLICDGGPLDKLSMANQEDISIGCASSITDDSSVPNVSTLIVGNGNTSPFPTVISGDIIACNGVVHVIDGVLIPGTPYEPTDAPVVPPTQAPVVPVAPTEAPVVTPSLAPVLPITPTNPPLDPTAVPVAPTAVPVVAPSVAPITPTEAPISGPPVVLQTIQPVALQGGAEFEDPNSYQAQALARTEEQEGIAALPPSKIIQYYVLYTIYAATNGVSNVITDSEGIPDPPGWIVNQGWDQTNVDPCVWFGITCEGDLVTEIDLFSNLLTGSFPPEVTLLASDGERSTGAGLLARIDLFDNMLLTNSGDNSWWPLLGSDFGYLFFKNTGFSGVLARLPDNIKEFDCSFSFISGGLNDANFQGLNSLVFANFDGNAYNSTVPSSFSSLPNLEFLYIVDGFISGDLSYMIGMPAMREHWADTNPGLGGPLPAAISTVSTLESFSITSCSFSGTIPPEFGNFGFVMKQMWMYDNDLTGTIPPELANMAALRLLQIEGNAFTGSMPAEICANTIFPKPLEDLGADCFDENFSCDCCTCCSVEECPI